MEFLRTLCRQPAANAPAAVVAATRFDSRRNRATEGEVLRGRIYLLPAALSDETNRSPASRFACRTASTDPALCERRNYNNVPANCGTLGALVSAVAAGKVRQLAAAAAATKKGGKTLTNRSDCCSVQCVVLHVRMLESLQEFSLPHAIHHCPNRRPASASWRSEGTALISLDITSHLT